MSNGSLPARSTPISNQKRSYRCIDVCVMVQNNKNAVIACMPSCDTSVTRAIGRAAYAGQLDHLNDVKVCLVACVPMSASGAFFKTKSKKKIADHARHKFAGETHRACPRLPIPWLSVQSMSPKPLRQQIKQTLSCKKIGPSSDMLGLQRTHQPSMPARPSRAPVPTARKILLQKTTSSTS
jgi:hypothetical protein